MGIQPGPHKRAGSRVGMAGVVKLQSPHNPTETQHIYADCDHSTEARMDEIPAGHDGPEERRKRKAIAQGQKACNPCRLRKVKCSFELPCQTCCDRQHPELCVYDPPSRRVRLESGQRTLVPPSTSSAEPWAPWTPSREDWDALSAKMSKLERTLDLVLGEVANKSSFTATQAGHSQHHTVQQATLDHDLPPIVHTKHPLTGDTIFLGANSVPAMALALTKSDDGESIRHLLAKSILPIFALENENTTYPFVDLWGLPHGSTERIEKLCELLPPDPDCFYFLKQYRDTAHVLYPGIIDIKQFEADVMQFLSTRSAQSLDPNSPPLTEQNVYGKNVHWLGLLFAGLASGCQCSNKPRRERQLTCQVYVCCAYECLRIINYLSCAQPVDIQNLLVLGNVISNSMNAGVAWMLLGLTTRLAQGLGLHRAPPPGASRSETRFRRDVWARVIWQDSLLSISYDRATPTTRITRWKEHHDRRPGEYSYAECMLQLCKIALDVVVSDPYEGTGARSVSQLDAPRLEECQHAISEIENQASNHLRDVAACLSIKDFLEHWNWNMHRSYVMSMLYRPGLAKRVGVEQSATHSDLRALCIDSLSGTVEAFIKLCNFTPFAVSSWAAVHRSLSSALLLGILGEPKRNEHVRNMLDKLITIMLNMEYSDASELPAPVSRAVVALQQLNGGGDGNERSKDSGGSATTTSSISDGESPLTQVQAILWGSLSS